jgi:anti-anti-sigma factor
VSEEKEGSFEEMHTLVLVGELDRRSTAALEAAIEGLCERAVARIVLDLRQLTRLDGTGAAVIAFRRGWCERRGVELRLVPGPAHVQRAFESSGLLERLEFGEPPARLPAIREEVQLTEA